METSQELQQAMDGDRASALAMWKRVKAGESGGEIALWLQHTAGLILEADQSERRDLAIVKAVGLVGTLDRHRKLRRMAEDLQGFGFTRAEIIEAVEQAGLVNPDHQEVRSIVDRELRKLK